MVGGRHIELLSPVKLMLARQGGERYTTLTRLNAPHERLDQFEICVEVVGKEQVKSRNVGFGVVPVHIKRFLDHSKKKTHFKTSTTERALYVSC